MSFSVFIVHFQVIWGHGKFGLKKGTGVDHAQICFEQLSLSSEILYNFQF